MRRRTVRVKDLLEVRAGDGEEEGEVGAAEDGVLDGIVGAGDRELEEVEDAVEDGHKESVEDLHKRELEDGGKEHPLRQ